MKTPTKCSLDTAGESRFAVRVGNAVRRARAAAGLTQGQLAADAGCERAHVARVESGSHLPTLRTLYRLSLVLRVPLSVLLGEREGIDQAADQAAAPRRKGRPPGPPKSEPPTGGSPGGSGGDLSPTLQSAPQLCPWCGKPVVARTSDGSDEVPEVFRRMFGGK